MFPAGRFARGGQRGQIFGAEHNVVERTQVLCQREVLMDHADASFKRGMGRSGFQFAQSGIGEAM